MKLSYLALLLPVACASAKSAVPDLTIETPPIPLASSRGYATAEVDPLEGTTFVTSRSVELALPEGKMEVSISAYGGQGERASLWGIQFHYIGTNWAWLRYPTPYLEADFDGAKTTRFPMSTTRRSANDLFVSESFMIRVDVEFIAHLQSAKSAHFRLYPAVFALSQESRNTLADVLRCIPELCSVFEPEPETHDHSLASGRLTPHSD